jgi:hypothetical protein
VFRHLLAGAERVCFAARIPPPIRPHNFLIFDGDYGEGGTVVSLGVDTEAGHFLYCAWMQGAVGDREDVVAACEVFSKETEVWEKRYSGRRSEPAPMWMRSLPGGWCDVDVLIHAVRHFKREDPLTGTRTRGLKDAVGNARSTQQRLVESNIPVPPSQTTWSQVMQRAFFANLAVYEPSIDCYYTVEGVVGHLSPYSSKLSCVIFTNGSLCCGKTEAETRGLLPVCARLCIL